jgi:hypothetical protein
MGNGGWCGGNMPGEGSIPSRRIALKNKGEAFHREAKVF